MLNNQKRFLIFTKRKLKIKERNLELIPHKLEFAKGFIEL